MRYFTDEINPVFFLWVLAMRIWVYIKGKLQIINANDRYVIIVSISIYSFKFFQIAYQYHFVEINPQKKPR